MKKPLLTGRVLLPAIPLKWGRVALACLEILLVIAAAYHASGLITGWLARGSWQLPVVTHSEHSSRPMPAQGFTLSFDPFYRARLAAPLAKTGTPPESQMKLKLFGLRADGKGGGSAILEGPDGAQKLVQVGGAVTNGVTLAAIYTDRVEITRAGLRETVYLDPAAKARASEAPTADQPVQSVAASTLASSLMRVQLAPVRQNGRLNGFRVLEETPADVLSGLGLEAEDILLSVAGTNLTSFERLEELPEILASASSLTLEYERRGQQLSRRIKVK